MERLSLTDSRWSELAHRGGTAEDIPVKLKHLLAHPDDVAAFSDMWPYLCSEGTAWPAAFAVVPYVVEIAAKLPRGQRTEHLAFIGLVRIGTDEQTGIRGDLRESYEAILPKALSMALDELSLEQTPADTRYLLATAAALKGYPKIGDAIQALDSLLDCPECGAEIESIEG